MFVTDRGVINSAQRIVIKVGSSLLTDLEQGIALEKIRAYSAQIATLVAQGKEVVLVSSGAVAEGCARLGWSTRPEAIHLLQAAAAVGQMGLVQAYERALADYDCPAAMIMLTHDDLANRQRYLNARATISQLLKLGVVPVINENDTVATEEIRFGDNDTLAAMVTNLLAADLLIILTDVDGLMSADPRVDAHATRIDQASAHAGHLDNLPGSEAGALGRGGMVTKLRAARLAASSGAHTIIASGLQDGVLTRIAKGEDLGTLLTAELSPLTARKRWIADQLKAQGELVVDAGAAQALIDAGVSLLAVGVVAVNGQFERGAVVSICDGSGRTIAQGLSNYASSDIAKLKGVKSEEFADHLDSVGEPELVHRDNLVVLS